MRYDATRVKGEVTEIQRIVGQELSRLRADWSRDILRETDARIGVAVPKPKTIEVGGQTPAHVKEVGTEGTSIDAARADHAHALLTDSPSGTLALSMNDDTLEGDWLGLNINADGVSVGRRTTLNLINFSSVVLNGDVIDVTAPDGGGGGDAGVIHKMRSWTFDRLEFYDHYNENTFYLLNVPGVTPAEKFAAASTIKRIYVRLHKDSAADAVTLALYKNSIDNDHKVMSCTISGSDGNYLAAESTTVLASGLDAFSTTDVPYLVMTTPDPSLAPAVEVVLHWDEDAAVASLGSLNELTGNPSIVAGDGLALTVEDPTITLDVVFGDGAGEVCEGNDARLSDARTPTAHASSHQHGGADEVGTATPAANAIPKADGSGRLDGWVSDASTTAKGKVELATSAETTAGLAVQASDTRLSDARTPTAHKASHAVGGSDALTAADLGQGTVRGLYTRTGAQTVANATYTFVDWQARTNNAGLTWSAVSNPSQITIGSGEAGHYLIAVSALFAADADGYRVATLVINSTTPATIRLPAITAGGIDTQVVFTWALTLAVGDMIRVQVYHTAGGDLSLLHASTSLWIDRLFPS